MLQGFCYSSMSLAKPFRSYSEHTHRFSVLKSDTFLFWSRALTGKSSQSLFIMFQEKFEVRGDVINGRNHQGPKRAREALTGKVQAPQGFKLCPALTVADVWLCWLSIWNLFQFLCYSVHTELYKFSSFIQEGWALLAVEQIFCRGSLSLEWMLSFYNTGLVVLNIILVLFLNSFGFWVTKSFVKYS